MSDLTLGGNLQNPDAADFQFPDAPGTNIGQAIPAEELYAPILAWVRRHLHKDELPYAAAGLEIELLVASLLLRWPCLGDYGTLSGNDKTFFDAAAGYSAAYLLRPRLPSTTAEGPLVKVETNNKTFQWAAPQAAAPAWESWPTEAWELLKQVGCIAAVWNETLSGFSVFGLAGRRRDLEERGYGSGRHNPLFTILQDLREERRGIWFPDCGRDGWEALR